MSVGLMLTGKNCIFVPLVYFWLLNARRRSRSITKTMLLLLELRRPPKALLDDWHLALINNHHRT